MGSVSTRVKTLHEESVVFCLRHEHDLGLDAASMSVIDLAPCVCIMVLFLFLCTSEEKEVKAIN